MLIMFYAYNRLNYCRWLPIYICDMVDLEENAPEVHKEFLLGKFSINRTGNPYAAVLTDMVLKQTLNKDSKGAGGLNGISNDEQARTKWFLSSHIRAHLY